MDRPRGRRWRQRSLFVAAVAVAGLSLARDADFVVVTPGPTFDLTAATTGAADGGLGDGGRLLATTVTVRPVSGLEVLWRRLTGDADIHPRGASDTTAAVQERIDATATAYDAAAAAVGEPTNPSDGARIVAVEEHAAAAGLTAGDVIVAVDGTATSSASAAADTIGDAGTTVSITVRRADTIRTFDVPNGPDGVGIRLTDHHRPARTGPDIALTGVTGSSAGLMTALAFVDAFGAGDLTGGRTIAGTGTIDGDGNVGAVRGTALKQQAAARDGATVFFVPAGTGTYDDGLTVVPVATLTEAVAWLCANDASDEVCAR